MGLEFIDRTLKTFGIVLLIALPFGIYYFGVYPGLAFFSGGMWGMVNLMLIRRLVQVTLRPDGIKIGPAFYLSFAKFPLLYLAGYGLLKVPVFEPLHLLIGFTSLLVVVVLKGIGASMWGSESDQGKSSKVRGVV